MFPQPQDLINEGSERVDAFIEWAWSGGISREQNFEEFNWWLGIAEIATTIAFREYRAQQGPIDLRWVRIALKIYDHIGVGSAKESIMLSAMNLKALLLLSAEQETTGSLASIDEIVKWFWDNLTVSLEDVHALLPFDNVRLQSMNREQILTLRRVKQRLSIMDRLRKGNKLTATPELSRWLEIARQLP